MMQLYPTLPAATYSSAPSIDKISTSMKVNVRIKQGKASRSTSIFKNNRFGLSALVTCNTPLHEFASR